jgi:hypothetical protein
MLKDSSVKKMSQRIVAADGDIHLPTFPDPVEGGNVSHMLNLMHHSWLH